MLDDATANRLIKVLTKTSDDKSMLDEQLDRWREGDLTEAQEREANRVKGQVRRIGTVVTSILGIADKLKHRPADLTLAQSDPHH